MKAYNLLQHCKDHLSSSSSLIPNNLDLSDHWPEKIKRSSLEYLIRKFKTNNLKSESQVDFNIYLQWTHSNWLPFSSVILLWQWLSKIKQKDSSQKSTLEIGSKSTRPKISLLKREAPTSWLTTSLRPPTQSMSTTTNCSLIKIDGK